MSVSVVEVTDVNGQVVTVNWLSNAESVHRQLRPQLPENYVERMQQIFAGGGRMLVAVDTLPESERVVGVAVWRIIENTFAGKVLYVDDLITDEQARSTGIGKALLSACEQMALRLHCTWLELDSGTQRKRAHRFYLREGMDIVSFHFSKPLSGNA